MRKQRNCFLLQEEENKMNEIRKDIRMNYIENFSWRYAAFDSEPTIT